MRNIADLGDPRQPLVERRDRPLRRDAGACRARGRRCRRRGSPSRAARPRRRTRAPRRRASRPGTGRRSRAARAAAPRPSRPRRRRRPPAPIADLPHEQPAPCRRARSPGSWIQSMNPSTSRTATGSLRPDSPSSVRASRRRSVEPRSSAKIAAPSVDGENRAEQQALERREVEQPGGGEAGDERGDDRPERGRARAPARAPGGSRQAGASGRPRTGSAPARRSRSCAPARSR